VRHPRVVTRLPRAVTACRTRSPRPPHAVAGRGHRPVHAWAAPGSRGRGPRRPRDPPPPHAATAAVTAPPHAVAAAPARGYRVPFTRFTRAGARPPRAGARPPRAGARLSRAVTASSRVVSAVAASGVSKSRIVSFQYHIISSLQTRRTTRREQVARLFQDRGAGLSPCARNTIREAISRDTSSSQHAGHAVRRNRTRNAAGTFSGHCQRSRRICEQKCGRPSLSDDEELVEEPVTSAPPKVCSSRGGALHCSCTPLFLHDTASRRTDSSCHSCALLQIYTY